MSRTEEHYSSPPVLDASPPTERVLLSLIEESPEDALLFFALGNVRLRKGELEKAREAFTRTLELDDALSAARCNYAIVLKGLGLEDDALAQLKQTILRNPDLTYAHLHLGRLLVKRGEWDQAEVAYERLLRAEPGHVEALLALGDIALERGDAKAAQDKFGRAFAGDPLSRETRFRLARLEFRAGRSEFRANNFVAALERWGRAEEQFGAAFSVDQEITAGMKELVAESRDAAQLDSVLRQETSPSWYDLFSLFFFTVGLWPQAFEDRWQLEASRRRWQQSLDSKGEHPYPHFRFAVIDAYEGKLDEALIQLRSLQDKLPGKKQEALRLQQFIRFVGDLTEVQRAKKKLPDSPDEEWVKAGFSSVFESEPWRKIGVTPSQAASWKARGFSAKQAEGWAESGLDAESATRIRDAGLQDPTVCGAWAKKGVAPESAARWQCEFDGLDAVLWLKSGIEEPTEARDWSKVFSLPGQAVQWRELGFTPKEALFWIRSGVTDAHTAKEEKDAGVKPDPDIKL